MDRFNPPFLRSGDGRVFVGFASTCGKAFELHACMRVDSRQKQRGTASAAYNGEEIAAIVMQKSGLWTANLTGRVPYTEESAIRRAFDEKCLVDLHVNYGYCRTVGDINEFDVAMILEDGILTDYSMTGMSTLEAVENALISETATLSFARSYTVNNDSLALVKSDAYSCYNLVAMANCPAELCDCRSAYGRIYALAVNTRNAYYPMRLLYSDDSGASWSYTNLVLDSYSVLNPLKHYGITCLGDYVVVTGKCFVAALNHEDINVGGDTQAENILIGTDFVGSAKQGDNLIIVTSAGVIYSVDESLIVRQLHATGLGNVYLMGTGDSLIYLADNTGGVNVLYSVAPSGDLTVVTTGLDNNAAITAIATNDNAVFVATQNGHVYCNGNLVFTGDCAHKIVFVSNNIGYILTSAGAYRTVDGGNTWSALTSFGSDSAAYLSVGFAQNVILGGALQSPDSTCLGDCYGFAADGGVWRESWRVSQIDN